MEENSKYQDSIFAPLLQKIDEAVTAFGNLNEMERHFALLCLIEEKIISFPELSKMYVDLLQKERDAKQGEVMSISLWLGLLLRDGDPDTEYMRRFLWEKGYHRGSAYGDKLDKEFKK